ncbi:hypothetical protein ABZ714_00105 [Streptomyces sp. NPDC006798]|uniref:hypothetical protein n=1 Tax=Streptomyces sp. NPDC006798 TaxID=3155462 RepID=UPI0033D94B1A
MIDTWADTEAACVGRLWAESGPGKEAVPLSSWLLTICDPSVAESVAEAFRTAEPRTSEDGDGFEVVLSGDTVTVVVTELATAVNRMVLGEGPKAHICDGEQFLEPGADASRPCGCAGELSDRKARARAGEGPTPDCRLVFRLATAPELGSFCFVSSSWEFALSLRSLMAETDDGAPATVDLIRRISRMTTRSGIQVTFTALLALPVRADSIDQSTVKLAV